MRPHTTPTRWIALNAAIGALLACGAAADPASKPQAADDARAGKIVIDNFTFEPSTLTVSVGTALTWLNEDDAPHTVVGTDPGSPIKSPPLDSGERYSITLTTPGTYRYFCSLHPHMTGTVIVEQRF
jgi:plastocyanin